MCRGCRKTCPECPPLPCENCPPSCQVWSKVRLREDWNLECKLCNMVECQTTQACCTLRLSVSPGPRGGATCLCHVLALSRLAYTRLAPYVRICVPGDHCRYTNEGGLLTPPFLEMITLTLHPHCSSTPTAICPNRHH